MGNNQEQDDKAMMVGGDEDGDDDIQEGVVLFYSSAKKKRATCVQAAARLFCCAPLVGLLVLLLLGRGFLNEEEERQQEGSDLLVAGYVCGDRPPSSHLLWSGHDDGRVEKNSSSNERVSVPLCLAFALPVPPEPEDDSETTVLPIAPLPVQAMCLDEHSTTLDNLMFCYSLDHHNWDQQQGEGGSPLPPQQQPQSASFWKSSCDPVSAGSDCNSWRISYGTLHDRSNDNLIDGYSVATSPWKLNESASEVENEALPFLGKRTWSYRYDDPINQGDWSWTDQDMIVSECANATTECYSQYHQPSTTTPTAGHNKKVYVTITVIASLLVCATIGNCVQWWFERSCHDDDDDDAGRERSSTSAAQCFGELAAFTVWIVCVVDVARGFKDCLPLFFIFFIWHCMVITWAMKILPTILGSICRATRPEECIPGLFVLVLHSAFVGGVSYGCINAAKMFFSNVPAYVQISYWGIVAVVDVVVIVRQIQLHVEERQHQQGRTLTRTSRRASELATDTPQCEQKESSQPLEIDDDEEIADDCSVGSTRQLG